MAEKHLVRIEGEDVTLELDRTSGAILVRREGAGAWKNVDLEQVGHSGLYVLMVDSRPTEIYLERRRGGAIVTIGRHTFDCDVGPWRPAAARSPKAVMATGRAEVDAPMTGSIVEVRCTQGEAVHVGQVLLVIESMKMNNEIRSPASGTVEAVPVVPGQRIKQGELLIAIQRSSG